MVAMPRRFLFVTICLVATVSFLVGLIVAGSTMPAPAQSAPPSHSMRRCKTSQRRREWKQSFFRIRKRTPCEAPTGDSPFIRTEALAKLRLERRFLVGHHHHVKHDEHECRILPQCGALKQHWRSTARAKFGCGWLQNQELNVSADCAGESGIQKGSIGKQERRDPSLP